MPNASVKCEIVTAGNRSYAVCTKCGHRSAAVFGHTRKSHKRAAMTLRKECPRGETNFYYSNSLDKPMQRAKTWWPAIRLAASLCFAVLVYFFWTNILAYLSPS